MLEPGQLAQGRGEVTCHDAMLVLCTDKITLVITEGVCDTFVGVPHLAWL
jgi:hypothetical protein